MATLRPAAGEIGRRGRRIRNLAVAAALVVLAAGSVEGTRDMFPFGPFTMYAGHYPTDGVMTSDVLMARTADGRTVSVSEADIGLTHAEIEVDVAGFRADPQRMATLAAAYHRRHPTAAPYRALWIAQERWQLHDRAVVHHSTVTLVRWSAS